MQPILSMFRKMDEYQRGMWGQALSIVRSALGDWLGPYIFVCCDMGQWCANVEACIKSLSPLNEMLVSEVHVNGSVI